MIVEHLPSEQKSKSNDAIWNETCPLPMKHQKLILERKAKAKKDLSRMLDWTKLPKHLDHKI